MPSVLALFGYLTFIESTVAREIFGEDLESVFSYQNTDNTHSLLEIFNF